MTDESSSFILTNLSSFLFSYEKSIQEIWECKQRFCQKNICPTLEWFPYDVPFPDRDYLHTVALHFIATPLDEFKISDKTLKTIKIFIIFLNFFEESGVLKKCLLKLGHILRHVEKTEKIQKVEYINLILLKCQLSRIAHDNGNKNDALLLAKTAFQMLNGFNEHFSKEKDNKSLQKKLYFVEIEVKLSLICAHTQNGNVSQALSLIDNVANNALISHDEVRTSRTSAFALSRFDLMLSYLCTLLPLTHAHPLHNALNALTNTCLRLDLIVPGICQILKCCEGISVSAVTPSFGINTKNSISDCLFQFEHIEHLFNCLYRVAYLWLKSGNLRFANLYISDGIILSRALFLPEKELKFEVLMGEIAVLEENFNKIENEVNIMKDILDFIAEIDKKNQSTRKYLCSNITSKSEENDLHTKTESNDSDVMQDCKDMPPINSVHLDVENVVSAFSDARSSPVLKRKYKCSKKLPSFYTHKEKCSCRLCTNQFLIRQQLLLGIYYSSYLDLTGYGSEAMICLKEALQFSQEKQVIEVGQKGDCLSNKERYNEINVLAFLALSLFKYGDIQAAKLYLNQAFKAFEDSTLVFDNNMLSLSYLTAGQILLPESTQLCLNVSFYVDDVIDNLSKFGVSFIPKTGDLVSKKNQQLLFAKSKKKALKCTPVMKDNKKIPNKCSSEEFSIFDEECDIDIKLINNKKSDKLKTPVRRTSRRIATQNIVAARKEARRVHRLERGPVYCNDEIEESRPATRREQSKFGRKHVRTNSKDVYYQNDNFSCNSDISAVVEKLHCMELRTNPQSKLDLDYLDCVDCLTKAFESSTLSCNYTQLKNAACLLSLYHYRHSNSLFASAYHIISVGITLRITLHNNLQLCKRSMERSIRKKLPQINDSSWIHHFNTVKNMVECTHPIHVISSMQDHKNFLANVCKDIPSDWSVCILSAYKEQQEDILLVTRLRHDQKPLHLHIQSSNMLMLKKKFEEFSMSNVDGMKTEEKSLWWTHRRNSNQLLEDFIKDLDNLSLGYHRGVLLGCPKEKQCKEELQRYVDEIIGSLLKEGGKQLSLCQNLIEVYMYVWKNLAVKDKTEAVLNLFHHASLHPNKTLVLNIIALFENSKSHFHSHRCKRGHVVLILDKQLQAYPWESVSILRSHSVSRMPSVDVLLYQLELNKLMSYAKANLQHVSYVINPKGDLAKTEERFANWFSSIPSWHGVMSRVPNKHDWMSYISDHDVFIFCGHGSGSFFMHREAIARHRSCACALLMGCSSGMLIEKGVTEPEGMALSYLMSGSPCVLACLWPVTDKDIDKYLAKCLCEWMKEGTCLTDLVREAESACKLPRLNGSACVVYGIPVQSCNVVENWFATIPSHFQDILY